AASSARASGSFAATRSRSAVVSFISSIIPSLSLRLSYDSADHLRGVVHHRDDAGVVDPGRTDHPDRTDDLLAAVLVRRDNHRTPGDAEQMIFGADKDLNAFRLPARVEQAQHGFLCFQHLE